MERTRVSSSIIYSIGFDETNNILEIEFNSGGVYQYFSVSQQIYLGLLQASSHGKYFDKYIKNAGYRYSKIKY